MIVTKYQFSTIFHLHIKERVASALFDPANRVPRIRFHKYHTRFPFITLQLCNLVLGKKLTLIPKINCTNPVKRRLVTTAK